MADFHAGHGQPVDHLLRIQNFSSQQRDKAMWETKFSQEAVLYMESGLPVWQDKSDIPPICRGTAGTISSL